jgi:hypothetical protein
MDFLRRKGVWLARLDNPRKTGWRDEYRDNTNVEGQYALRSKNVPRHYFCRYVSSRYYSCCFQRLIRRFQG